MGFIDREEAGERLAERLLSHASDDLVVLGLPRGGVPVAAQVARRLRSPLDAIFVRKLGVPRQPELAMGAIGEDGVCTLNQEVIDLARVDPADLLAIEAEERRELERRSEMLRSLRPRIDLEGRIALIVDDGLATGATAIAACEVARAHGAKYIIVAVPVAPVDAAATLRGHADEFISLETPSRFVAVGLHYANFDPVTDDEVIELFEQTEFDESASDQSRNPEDLEGVSVRDVTIQAGLADLPGRLTLPENPVGLVLFAHGSGSSRNSPRNVFVAQRLHEVGLGTLLFDLLTHDEERDRANVFDIALLASRLHAATVWARTQPELAFLPIGYFGASTGASAALVATTFPSSRIAAVVSRGGRPDLANSRLPLVRTPTLLLVGGADNVVLTLNRAAQSRMQCESELEVIPGATHLFEEPGTLEEVAASAGRWFTHHMSWKLSRQ